MKLLREKKRTERRKSKSPSLSTLGRGRRKKKKKKRGSRSHSYCFCDQTGNEPARSPSLYGGHCLCLGPDCSLLIPMPEIDKDDGERATETAAETVDANASLRTSSPSTGGDEDRTLSCPSAPTVLLRIRGLPYGANEHDVEKFFCSNSLVAAYICRRAGWSYLSIFFLIGFGAKALSQGRKGFASFLLACSLSSLSLALSLARSHFRLSLSLSLQSSRPPHGRRLRRVRHRGRSLARPRREAARLPRQPVRRAVPRARRRPRRRPRQRGQAATGRAGQPRATPSRAAVHRRGGGRRRVPARAKDGKGGGRRGGGGREGEQRRGIEPEDGGRGGGAGVPADKPRSDAPPRPAGRRLHLEPGRKALGGGLRRV